MRNFLEVDAAEFKLATKIFCGKRCKLGPVLLAYESGFLSIESGEATAVIEQPVSGMVERHSHRRSCAL